MADSTEPRDPLSRTFAGGSDVVFDFTCQPCSADNKTLEAVGFCVDCSEFLCDECFRYHLRPTLMRNHKLLDIEEAKKNKDIARYRDVCTEKCSQHRGEIVKYFCFDHDILGCEACMTVDHRSCPGVKYIPDIAEDVAKGDTYSGLIGELDTVVLRTKCLISKSTKNKAKSQSHCDKLLSDMEHIKKELMEAFEKLMKAMQTEAVKMKMKETQKMDENIALFHNIQHKADTLASQLKSMKDNGQYCKLFASMMKEKCDITSLDDKLDKAATDNNTDDYIFEPSAQLEELMKCKDSLGKLREQVDVKNKTTKLDEIQMRTESDIKTCDIAGLATLPGDRLVAADYSNKNVKLVDVKQVKVISELKLPNNPLDITVTDETDEIAITLYDQCKLLLIKISENSLLQHREITTSTRCWGVASVLDNLVVNLGSPERLEIIDKLGNVLHKIEHDQNGKQLFSNVHSFAVSQDRGMIYVPDFNKNTVTCLSLTGKVKAVYKDNDLQAPSCAAVDGRGNVYVGGEGSKNVSKNVHQITPDCRKISILLSQEDDIGGIQAMCYITETDRLYVGKKSDTLLAF